MLFEVCPDPLIKDKYFKTLFLTVQSSGHELHLWHGKSSNTPQVLTLSQRENNKLCTGLSHYRHWKNTRWLLIHSWNLASLCVISEHNRKLLWVQRSVQCCSGLSRRQVNLQLYHPVSLGILLWLDLKLSVLWRHTAGFLGILLYYTCSSQCISLAKRVLIFLFRRMNCGNGCLHWQCAIFLFVCFLPFAERSYNICTKQ